MPVSTVDLMEAQPVPLLCFSKPHLSNKENPSPYVGGLSSAVWAGLGVRPLRSEWAAECSREVLPVSPLRDKYSRGESCSSVGGGGRCVSWSRIPTAAYGESLSPSDTQELRLLSHVHRSRKLLGAEWAETVLRSPVESNPQRHPTFMYAAMKFNQCILQDIPANDNENKVWKWWVERRQAVCLSLSHIWCVKC